MNGYDTFVWPPGWVSTAQSAAAKAEYIQKVTYGLRRLDRIILCRRPVTGITQLNGSLPGHYWVEIINENENENKNVNENELATTQNGYRESYGWYPAVSTYFGPVTGCLNGDSVDRRDEDENKKLGYKSKRSAGRADTPNDISSRAFDPHQCDRFTPRKINHISSPYLLPDDNRTEEEVINKIRKFAKEYKGEWSYHLDKFDENNCHTFFLLLLADIKVADIIIADGKCKHFNAYYDNVNWMKSSDPDVNERFNQLELLKNKSLKAKQMIKLMNE